LLILKLINAHNVELIHYVLIRSKLEIANIERKNAISL